MPNSPYYHLIEYMHAQQFPLRDVQSLALFVPNAAAYWAELADSRQYYCGDNVLPARDVWAAWTRKEAK